MDTMNFSTIEEFFPVYRHSIFPFSRSKDDPVVSNKKIETGIDSYLELKTQVRNIDRLV